MNFKRIGWFTTGRDEAAIDLLKIVYSEIKRGFLPLKIAYVFISKELGEGIFSDKLINLAKKELGLKVISFSALRFEPELRKKDKELWRKLYHEEVLKRLDEEIDFGVLAGYMWIVSPKFCNSLKLINLHPALPGGPKGSWQEVMWQLISARSAETGAMMHLVTPELDEGPPISFFRLPLRTPEFLPLWEETEKKLLKYHLTGLKNLEGEENRLFKKIREEELKRELPLIVYTLKYLGEDKILFDSEDLPLDLTEEIENYIKRGGHHE
ncbi:MAG: formyl transferase [Thermodesulfobacterium geofontis]|uniref:phosphoribosylglycinamide formyltransferase 1 n=1 Tax=Thermodesulfobacterium geofontis TaxID=1295609 RepID=A0A2N7Q7V9_9BACT|nr:MAG: formyl transferase [Thermodesulfobacterium geofontis]PMP94217.1 MAG: formyl transferase [Thermodesulfobacterium geofontis]